MALTVTGAWLAIPFLWVIGLFKQVTALKFTAKGLQANHLYYLVAHGGPLTAPGALATVTSDSAGTANFPTLNGVLDALQPFNDDGTGKEKPALSHTYKVYVAENATTLDTAVTGSIRFTWAQGSLVYGIIIAIIGIIVGSIFLKASGKRRNGRRYS